MNHANRNWFQFNVNRLCSVARFFIIFDFSITYSQIPILKKEIEVYMYNRPYWIHHFGSTILSYPLSLKFLYWIGNIRSAILDSSYWINHIKSAILVHPYLIIENQQKFKDQETSRELAKKNIDLRALWEAKKKKTVSNYVRQLVSDLEWGEKKELETKQILLH